MFNLPPLIKVGSVGVVCFMAAYVNHLLFQGYILSEVLPGSTIFWICSVFYIFVILFFADYHWEQKNWLLLIVWIVLHLSLIINALQYVYGEFPPWYSQYTQSGSMVVYSLLLLFVKGKFPNWLRLFSIVNLLVLIPCIWFYFEQAWEAYEYLVYALCCTPILKSFVFIKNEFDYDEEVVDN